jgi:hypothetical protein
MRLARASREREIAAESIEHERWIAGIPGARLIVTGDSSHNVAIEQPALVVSAIKQVLEARRPSM